MTVSLGPHVARGSRFDFGDETEARAGVFHFVQRCQVFTGAWEDADLAGRFRLVLELRERTPSCSTPEERAVVATVVHEVAHRFLRVFCGHPAALAAPRVCGRVFEPTRNHVSAALMAIAAAHTRTEVGLGDIAAEVGVSRWTLSRALNETLGRGFPECLNAFRVLRGVVLLRSTRLSVKEIAAAVGYSWTSALDKQFGAWLHMTPTEFRSVPKILLR